MTAQVRTNPTAVENFDGKLQTLRSTITTLLHEIKTQASPVVIDRDRGIDFYENVERYEIELIRRALEAADGKQTIAARLLNLPTSTLCSKIKQLKIAKPNRFSSLLEK